MNSVLGLFSVSLVEMSLSLKLARSLFYHYYLQASSGCHRHTFGAVSTRYNWVGHKCMREKGVFPKLSPEGNRRTIHSCWEENRLGKIFGCVQIRTI